MTRIKVAKTVYPIDFSQLSGREFERLAFAFLLRRWPWTELDWCGQRGSDGGRDIRGVRESDWGQDEVVIVACANYRTLTKRKVRSDITALAKREAVVHALLVIGGGDVSANLKEDTGDYARLKGIQRAEVWSGAEFEEHLRFHAGEVLRRLFNGEELPDDPQALRSLARDMSGTEAEAVALIARAFERPAFTTPLDCESNLGDFRRAISDTIETINTGLHRTRDGTLIGRYPSVNDFTDPSIRAVLKHVAAELNVLRVEFDRLSKAGLMRECPGHVHFEPGSGRTMERIRRDILDAMRGLAPEVIPPPGFLVF